MFQLGWHVRRKLERTNLLHHPLSIQVQLQCSAESVVPQSMSFQFHSIFSVLQRSFHKLNNLLQESHRRSPDQKQARNCLLLLSSHSLSQKSFPANLSWRWYHCTTSLLNICRCCTDPLLLGTRLSVWFQGLICRDEYRRFKTDHPSQSRTCLAL